MRMAGHRKTAWLRCGVVLLILHVAAGAQAQAVGVGPEIFVGQPASPAEVRTRAVPRAVAAPGRTIELPPTTAAERSARSPDASAVAPGPHEIGFGRDLARLRGSPVGTADLVWQDAADGARVASLAIVSPGAGALRAQLELTSPPETLEVAVLRPGRSASHRRGGPGCGTPRRAVAGRGGAVLVAHGGGRRHRRRVPSAAGRAGQARGVDRAGLHLDSHPAAATRSIPECGHTDTACAADVLSDIARRSIAMYSYTTDDGRTGTCTGTLLNDLDPTTQTPYFLTAHHCVRSEVRVASMELYWFYEREVCGEPALQRFVRQGGGATLLASEGYVTGTDFALLRLSRAPPTGAGMAGWSAEQLSTTDPVAGMHHPKSLRKKIFAGRVTKFAPFQSFWLPAGTAAPPMSTSTSTGMLRKAAAAGPHCGSASTGTTM